MTDLELWREIAVVLQEAIGADPDFLTGVGPDTRLDGDELAALSELLRRRYGGCVDLVALVAGLDLDEIVALTVADVAKHVAAHRAPVAPAGRR